MMTFLQKARSYFFICASLALGQIVQAQAQIIPFDASAMTIDGAMQPAEWATASKTYIGVSATDSVQVLMKHDGIAFYFAFTGKLESANMLFPEILFDPQLQRTTSWINGQWWFHVSATDCEYNGSYGVYTSCLAVQPDWVGAPNFAPGTPLSDTVEIRIAYSKIGFSAGQDSLGMALVVTNTASIWKLWPASADKYAPNTWTTVAVMKPTAVPYTKPDYTGVTTPNPANKGLHLACKGNIADKKINAQLVDVTGKIVVSGTTENGIIQLNTTTLPAAMYTLCIYDDKGGRHTEQVLVAH